MECATSGDLGQQQMWAPTWKKCHGPVTTIRGRTAREQKQLIPPRGLNRQKSGPMHRLFQDIQPLNPVEVWGSAPLETDR